MSFSTYYVRCGWCGSSISNIDSLVELCAKAVYGTPSEAEILEMKKAIVETEELNLILDEEGRLNAPVHMHYLGPVQSQKPEELPHIRKSPCT